MIEKPPIDDAQLYGEIVHRLVQTAAPDTVIVFGSRARGDHRPESDVDILVVAESDKPRYARSGSIYSALAGLPVEVDILVYTPREVHEWSKVPLAFVTTATCEGTVLYERQR